MRAAPILGMHLRRFLLGLGCVLALACGDDIDAQAAPFCTEGMACPAGTHCVDGVMCMADRGAQDRRDPPRFDLFRPGRIGQPRPPRQRDAGRGGVTDAGAQGRDGGPDTGECLDGEALCTGGCANLGIDPNNCGACGIVCPGGQLCSLGVCCDAAGTVCGGQCVDVFTDRRHCGVCGFACEPGARCVLGLCTPDGGPLLPGFEGPPGF